MQIAERVLLNKHVVCEMFHVHRTYSNNNNNKNNTLPFKFELSGAVVKACLLLCLRNWFFCFLLDNDGNYEDKSHNWIEAVERVIFSVLIGGVKILVLSNWTDWEAKKGLFWKNWDASREALVGLGWWASVFVTSACATCSDFFIRNKRATTKAMQYGVL